MEITVNYCNTCKSATTPTGARVRHAAHDTEKISLDEARSRQVPFEKCWECGIEYPVIFIDLNGVCNFCSGS